MGWLVEMGEILLQQSSNEFDFGAILRFESEFWSVTKEKASSTLLLPFFWANRIEIFRSFEIPEVSLYKIFKLFFCNKVTKTFKHFCILTTQSFFWE